MANRFGRIIDHNDKLYHENCQSLLFNLPSECGVMIKNRELEMT